MSTSKTGKHGHAKVHLIAIDVSRVHLCFGGVLTNYLYSDLHRQKVGKSFHILASFLFS